MWVLLGFVVHMHAGFGADSTALPLAVRLPSALTPPDLERIRLLRQYVLASGDADLVENRTFGENMTNATTAETTFLHTVLDSRMPELRPHLRSLAVAADRLAGWAVIGDAAADAGSARPELAARCMELIRYQFNGLSAAQRVGWHADGSTLVTMAVMLSSPSEYEGGAVELTDDSTTESHTLAVGEAIAWRGWTSHRVNPVVSGARQVVLLRAVCCMPYALCSGCALHVACCMPLHVASCMSAWHMLRDVWCACVRRSASLRDT
jgi:hypothetical protein